MRVGAKIAAREWILTAIQNHSCIPNKETEREIRKFMERLQRDLRQLNRSKDLYLAVNSDNPETKNRAIQRLGEQPRPKTKYRSKSRAQEKEIARLVKLQREDANDRIIRFDHAISK